MKGSRPMSMLSAPSWLSTDSRWQRLRSIASSIQTDSARLSALTASILSPPESLTVSGDFGPSIVDSSEEQSQATQLRSPSSTAA